MVHQKPIKSSKKAGYTYF